MKNSIYNKVYIYNKVKSMAGIAMLLLCSCDAENSISTKYPCQFIFRTNLHPGTSIETALNNAGSYTW